MSDDHLNLTPELLLDPTGAAETASAVQEAPQAPSLTLESSITLEDGAAAQKAKEVQAVQIDESMLSEAERKIVNDFADKIDITDSNVVLQYGAAAQKNISTFSENSLNSVRTKDLGQVGEALSGLWWSSRVLPSRRRRASPASSRRSAMRWRRSRPATPRRRPM